ncbi:MAG TPA: hypothetical protein VL402_08665 [Xanthobacteraceae bacterium]|jgi:hypothetical protein|nr:hypothetical protein [Xanthobacteraceae bacterium]
MPLCRSFFFVTLAIAATGATAQAQFTTPGQQPQFSNPNQPSGFSKTTEQPGFSNPNQQPGFSNPNQPAGPSNSNQPQFSTPGQAPQFSAPGQAPQFSAPRQQSQFGGQPQQKPACITKIESYKDAAEKSADAIKNAQKKRPSPAEGCKLFTNFSKAFTSYVNYLAKEGKECGVPPEAVPALKKELVAINGTKKKVCDVAARPQGPPPASLSNALNGPLTAPSEKPKKGRNTFDTLTGNVLTR